MGYHLTILRTERGKPKPITREELAAAVPKLAGWEFAPEPDVLTYNADDEPPLWLQYHPDDGELWMKAGVENCTEEGFKPLLALAAALSARLRGDEMETYRTFNDSYTHPDDEAELAAFRPVAKLPRGRHLWNGFRIVVLIGLFAHLIYRSYMAWISRGS